MAAVHLLEKELVKATKIKALDHEDRQDFLAAVSRAAHKLKDDDYDNLSNEAAIWHKAAVDALNAKEEIPDFDGSIGDEAPETEADEPEATETEDEASEDEDEVDEPELELEEPAPKKKVAPAAKPAKAEKAPPKPSKAATKKRLEENKLKRIKYSELSGEKDKFGIIDGTKTSQAVAMYEKGATTAEIRAALQGRYFNILRKLTADGHLVEKKENGKIYVIHKDDVKAKKAKK